MKFYIKAPYTAIFDEKQRKFDNYFDSLFVEVKSLPKQAGIFIQGSCN